MCGRYTIKEGRFQKVEAALGAEFPAVEPRFNIAPTQAVPVIRPREGCGFELLPMRWGLIPAWSKEPKTAFATFNARLETVDQKPAFRGAFRYRRCILPASGFYEWRTTGTQKQPFYFSSPEEDNLAFAGLWEVWEGAEGSHLLSCTILVGAANPLVAEVHDRMAVILPMDQLRRWLDPATSKQDLLALAARPFPREGLQVWPVSPAVGNPRSQGPQLIQPLERPL